MTVTAEHIPPEVVEAAAITNLREINRWTDEVAREIWRSMHPSEKAQRRARARAAIAAGLAAWPGMGTGPNIYGRQDAVIHLPIPAQEPGDE